MKNTNPENIIDFLYNESDQKASENDFDANELSDFQEIHKMLELESQKQSFHSKKDQNWDKIQSHINQTNKPTSTKVVYYRKVFSYVALLTLGLLLGILAPHFIQKEQPKYLSEIHVPNGQTSKLVLSDSTIIWVNSGSTLKLGNFENQEERNVWLEGEAYFEVAHNKNKPFNVIGPSVDIQVLGTSFNANFYKEDSKNSVFLAEGSVAMKDKKGKSLITIKPSETVILNKKTNKLMLKHGGENLFINWSNGRLILRSVTLEELALKLERWYNVDIIFTNSKVKDIKISGTVLKNKPIGQMLEVIKLMSNVNYEVISKQNEKDKVIFK